MNIPDDMLAEIDAQAEADFSTRSAAIKKLYRQKWSGLHHNGQELSQPHQSASTRISQHQPARPQDTRARVPLQDKQTDRQEDLFGPSTDRERQIAEVAEAIRSEQWFGMRLPKADTPETYAARLVRAYPEACTGEMIRDAAMWVYNNPKRRAGKRYLGGFLTNWAKRARERRRATGSTTRRQAEPVDYEAGCDTVDIGE